MSQVALAGNFAELHTCRRIFDVRVSMVNSNVTDTSEYPADSEHPGDDPELERHDAEAAEFDEDPIAGPPPGDETGEQEPPDPDWSTDPASGQQRLEAVLFLSRQPLTSRKLSELAGLEDGTQARTMVRQLCEHYDEVGRAFTIKRVAGGFQMYTRPQFAKWIRRLEHVPRPNRLSGPLMETLAVVAYRQPILKADIESIRGVSCGEMLRQLLERGLVKIAGRSPELGRPFLYATTRKFLAMFGLYSIDQLPRSGQLKGKGLPNWTPLPTHPESPPNDPNPETADSNQHAALVEADDNDSITTSNPDCVD